MLRADNVGCGISTSGTGTWTLAADPSGAGFTDPYSAFNGQTPSNIAPISYTALVYDNSASPNWTKLKAREKGYGYLDVSGGALTSATLTRNPVWVESPMGTVTRASLVSPATGLSIASGDVANTVVEIAPSVLDVPQGLVSLNSSTSIGSDTVGGFMAGIVPCGVPTGGGTNMTITPGTVYYYLVKLDHADLIKTLGFAVFAIISGGGYTLYASLHALDFGGLPGRKLIDFGSSTSIVNGTTGFATMSAASGRLITPGYYVVALLNAQTGTAGTGNFQLRMMTPSGTSPWGTRFGTTLGPIGVLAGPTGQTSISDPANVSTLSAGISGNAQQLFCTFRSV